MMNIRRSPRLFEACLSRSHMLAQSSDYMGECTDNPRANV